MRGVTVILTFALLAVVAAHGDGNGGHKKHIECRGQPFIYTGVKDAFQTCKPKLSMGGGKSNHNAGGDGCHMDFGDCMATELKFVTTEGTEKKFHKDVMISVFKGFYAAPVGGDLAKLMDDHCFTDAMFKSIEKSDDKCKAGKKLQDCMKNQFMGYCHSKQ